MTQYVPKELNEEVNYRKTSSVREFIELLVKLSLALVIVYVLLGIAVDYIAVRIPPQFEEKLGSLFSKKFDKEAPSEQEIQLKNILDSLLANAQGLSKLEYKVFVEKSDQVNAIALPGGNIVIFSELLKDVKSENEMAMILSHELGHFANRDHLKGLGRGLILLSMSMIFVGTDQFTGRFVSKYLSGAQMKFSQDQEKAADRYALDLLTKTYGHSGGATDFFKKMAAKERLGDFFYIMSTHPNPGERAKDIERLIHQKNYSVLELKPIVFEPIKEESTQKDETSK